MFASLHAPPSPSLAHPARRCPLRPASIVLGLAALLGAASAQSVAPSLQLDHVEGRARLTLTTQAGTHHTLEAVDASLGSAAWVPVLESIPAGNQLVWVDGQSTLGGARFYRALRHDVPPPPAPVPNFRLIDHQGRSHELNYHLPDPGVRSIVLVFVGDDCPAVDAVLTDLETLQARFAADGIRFWFVDSSTPGTRSNLVRMAAAKGILRPILHDLARLVAGELRPAANPEAWALAKVDGAWAPIYRGAIDDRQGTLTSASTQFYLSNALAAWVSGLPVSILRTRSAGCDPALPSRPTPDYATDIAPLLQDKCVRCHSPGNIAPWAMTNHSIVSLYAQPIKEEVLEGHMPPWHADPLYGTFANDFSLTAAEAQALVGWIDAGAPRGAGPDPLTNVANLPTDYPLAWPASLGSPDRVLSIPVQSIPTTGEIPYRYFSVTNPYPSDVWLRAAVVLPGNTRVVHHCLVLEGTSSTGLDGFFAGYVPGYEATAFPTNTAKLLRRGQVLRFQMHYTPTGQLETDQTRLGLYLAPTPPLYALQTKSAVNTISIPPGEADYQAVAQFPLPPPFGTGTFQKNILLYEMSPHMHLRGRRFRYEVILPDGSREILLSVPHYEFHWQTLYRLKQPRLIPAGSRIVCTAGWDNSAQNPDNPNPAASVSWGEQTDDEMFIGYLNFAELP